MKQITHLALLLTNLLAVSALVVRQSPPGGGQTSGASKSRTIDGVKLPASKAGKTQQAANHVVYTADSTVFGALLRSMESLSVHLSAPENCTIHLIVPQVDHEKALSLAQCFRQRLQAAGHLPEVVIHDVRPTPIAAAYPDRTDLQGHAAAYARLFLPEYLPNVSRVVYLDSDTLLRGDLTPLFEMPLTHALAAVEEGTSFNDLWAKWYPGLTQYVRDPKGSIFNDGVLILDIQRWRAENITGDIQNWAVNAGAAVDDQLLLNLEFQVSKDFDRLPHQWNDFRVRPTGWPDHGWSDEMAPEDWLSNAQVLHWTGPKPWNSDDGSSKQQWMQQYRNLWEVPGSNVTTTCDAAMR